MALILSHCRISALVFGGWLTSSPISDSTAHATLLYSKTWRLDVNSGKPVHFLPEVHSHSGASTVGPALSPDLTSTRLSTSRPEFLQRKPKSLGLDSAVQPGEGTPLRGLDHSPTSLPLGLPESCLHPLYVNDRIEQLLWGHSLPASQQAGLSRTRCPWSKHAGEPPAWLWESCVTRRRPLGPASLKRGFSSFSGFPLVFHFTHWSAPPR